LTVASRRADTRLVMGLCIHGRQFLAGDKFVSLAENRNGRIKSHH
jgi:hypothetical protein